MTLYTATIQLKIVTDTIEEAAELVREIASYAVYDSDADGFAARGVFDASVIEVAEGEHTSFVSTTSF